MKTYILNGVPMEIDPDEEQAFLFKNPGAKLQTTKSSTKNTIQETILSRTNKQKKQETKKNTNFDEDKKKISEKF